MTSTNLNLRCCVDILRRGSDTMLEAYKLYGKDRLLLIFAAVVVCVPPIMISHDVETSEAVFALSLREMMVSGD